MEQAVLIHLKLVDPLGEEVGPDRDSDELDDFQLRRQLGCLLQVERVGGALAQLDADRLHLHAQVCLALLLGWQLLVTFYEEGKHFIDEEVEEAVAHRRP